MGALLLGFSMGVGGIGKGWAQDESLVADLSDDKIELKYSFTGRDLLLFGAIDHVGHGVGEDPYDIVVVIEGPYEPIVVRKKAKIAGIWINDTVATYEDAPTFYTVSSNKALVDIGTERTLKALKIGLENLELVANEDISSEMNDSFQKGLIRNKIAKGLYQNMGGGSVKVMGNTLFRTEVHFPSNVPVGDYNATVYLFQNGHVLLEQNNFLTVEKKGFAEAVYNFANDHPAYYGLMAIFIALFSGWVAGTVVRD
jgi:uncharacterized protein (TIGR02186 family)